MRFINVLLTYLLTQVLFDMGVRPRGARCAYAWPPSLAAGHRWLL